MQPVVTLYAWSRRDAAQPLRPRHISLSPAKAIGHGSACTQAFRKAPNETQGVRSIDGRAYDVVRSAFGMVLARVLAMVRLHHLLGSSAIAGCLGLGACAERTSEPPVTSSPERSDPSHRNPACRDCGTGR